MRPVDLHGIENRQGVARQHLDGTVGGTDARAAVTANVVANDAMPTQKVRHLRIPHAEVDAQGVQQQEHWRLGGAFHLVMDIDGR
jgi:hypothetical protein